MSATVSTFEDCLPLTRLYAQFDAIAEGLVHGDSTAAHRAVLYRLASNRRTAEALGWTACVLERQGGSGRLLLRGVRSGGLAREVVPDWIPRRPEATKTEWNARVQRSPSDRKQERYRHLEVLIRERLLAASPVMTPDAFERLARRLVAAVHKHAKSHASELTPAGSVATVPDRETAAEARWLDDGGA